MKVIYDFSIRAMSRLLQLTKKGDSKLSRLVKGRRRVFDELRFFRQGSGEELIWIHVASLGEYEQAKPVIAKLKEAFPSYVVALTFFSPSGYENVAKKPHPNVDFMTYLPFDTPGNAKLFLQVLHPKMILFVKYDLWANYILEAKAREIPLFLFSASMRKSQVYFRFYGGFFRKVIRSFDHVFTQNQATYTLLKGIGVKKVTVAGDTRFDNVHAISQQPKSFPDVADFVGDKKVLVVGSAWAEDMELIVPFINSTKNYRIIIAPHDINHEIIMKWAGKINKKSIKYSEMADDKVDAEVLFIDNIGMLSSLYQYAHIAYVGGAFGKGLHNILEPLAFKVPTIFGQLKKAEKFPEAPTSQEYGCGFEVRDADGFREVMLALEQEEMYTKAKAASEKLVRDNLGSAEKIVKMVKNTIQ